MPISPTTTSVSGFGKLLHWLISQIIFPVRIDVLILSGELDINAQIMNCGVNTNNSIDFVGFLLLRAVISLIGVEGDDLCMKREEAPVPPIVSTNSIA